MTVEATLLRYGRRLVAAKSSTLVGGSTNKSCVSWSRLAASSTSSTSGSFRFNSSGSGGVSTLPTQQYHHNRRSIHSSDIIKLAETGNTNNLGLGFLQNLPPKVRTAILSDLHAVDLDKNGIIDSDELKLLLSKHATSFTDDEVVELTELFYASTGGHGVEVMRFLEALDAAIDDKSTSGGGEMIQGETSPLVEGGKFKTHPLGIGTCASEYSELFWLPLLCE